MTRLVALILLLAIAPARAADLAIGLTDDVIEVNASFAGAKVVLFGALTGDNAERSSAEKPYDIVAVIRGPASTFEIRPMIHTGMIWSAGAPIHIRGAPSAFLVRSSRPLADIAPSPLSDAYRLEASARDLAAAITPSNPLAAAFVKSSGRQVIAEAFLGAMRAEGLYGEKTDAVSFHKDSLFSIAIDLPPKTPVGDYVVDVYLVEHGKVLSHDSARLAVSKVGIERRIYELAHQRPIAYGLVCVILAAGAGWLAAEALRKRA
ncbi:MAG TPA: TIGR02186 family protein, partial [Parvularculaceae bacterium]|nr:TIGR02186 family protein [Parvularculaceae bacterium]